MAKITFPSTGGQICLNVTIDQTFKCTDGSSGTRSCSLFGSSDTKCSGTRITSSFTPATGASSGDVYLDENGCLNCDLVNPSEEDIFIGEFCLEVQINGSTNTECTDIWIEGSEGEPTYSDYKLILSPDTAYTFPAEGGTYCFKWYVTATVTYPDGSVETDCDVTELMDTYDFTGNESGAFQVIEDSEDTVHGICVTAYANESDDSRETCAGIDIVSPVSLSGCITIAQQGAGECVYEEIDVSGFTYSNYSDAPLSVCGGSISPVSRCYQYKTCGGVRSCNEDLQLEYTWVSQNVSSAILDPETGSVTLNESNMTSSEPRAIGTIRLTASYGTSEPQSKDVVLLQAAGDGNIYDNPCIEAVDGTSVPAEGGSLDLFTQFTYWQNYNCDNPGTVDCKDSGTGLGCQQCPSADPAVNCSSATFTFEVEETYDGAVVSIDGNGILTTTHANTTDAEMVIAKIKVTVSWHCVDSELEFLVYQEGVESGCTYEDPVIDLSYEYTTIPKEGVIDMVPILAYSQKWECNDGTSGTITTGADVAYTFESYVGDDFSVTSDGLVYCDVSIGARTVGSVTVTVTLNDASNSATITFAQAGEMDGEWGYPQISCSYPNISKDGGYSDINLTVTSYKYGDDGSVVDWRTYQMESGAVTYNDYGDDLTSLEFVLIDVFVSGTEYDYSTGRITKTSANEGGSALLLGNVLVNAYAFRKMNEGLFPVYQNAETDTYVASISTSSQFTALIGNIYNRSVADIRIYGDRYEDGELVEPDVILATVGYESGKIISKGDVFYGHFNDGVSCGEYHINKLGIRGYQEQAYPQYLPDASELRIDNNYTGDLETPPTIDTYPTEIPPINITNNGPNCELYLAVISYS